MSRWTKADLEALIGQEENEKREFKSSRSIWDGVKKSVDDKITKTVSAFLNSDGGTLFIGIEESEEKSGRTPDTASSISEGVPKSQWSPKSLYDAICSGISPSCNSFVSFDFVEVGKAGDEPLIVYIIEVRPGSTAYQNSSDKIYYLRDRFSSRAMEDRDIRLRMLSDEKPRGDVRVEVLLATDRHVVEKYRSDRETLRKRKEELISERGSLTDGEQAELADLALSLPSIRLDIAVRLMLHNIGTVTIKEGAIAAELKLPYLMNNSGGTEILEYFSFNNPGDLFHALYPDMNRCIREWKISFDPAYTLKTESMELLGVSVYLDNGPSVVRNKDFDLTEKVYAIIENVKKRTIEEI